MMWPFKWNLFASTLLSQGTVCHSAFYKKKFGMFLSVCFGTSGSERVKMTAEIGYKIWIGLQLNMARYRWGVARVPAASPRSTRGNFHHILLILMHPTYWERGLWSSINFWPSNDSQYVFHTFFLVKNKNISSLSSNSDQLAFIISYYHKLFTPLQYQTSKLSSNYQSLNSLYMCLTKYIWLRQAKKNSLIIIV